jgi:lysophospholipase L1-like esterase
VSRDDPPGGADRKRDSLPITALAVSVIPAFVLADFGVASARGWSLDNHFDRTFIVGSGAVLGLLCLALATRAGRDALRRLSSRLRLGIASSLVCLALAELVLQVAVEPPESYRKFHRKPPGHHYVFHPDPSVFPGVSGEAHYRTNEDGLRAPPRPARAEVERIVCIGGSTTICTYLDDSEVWSRVLMERLNAGLAEPRYWVGNAGKNGYSTTHHLRLLEDSAFLQEMDIAIFLVGVNDLSLALAGRKVKLRDGLPPLWRRTALLDLLARSIALIRARERNEVEDDRGLSYVARREARQKAPRVTVLPDLESALRRHEERIRSMVERTRAAGVRPIFLTQPVLWSDSPSERTKRLVWLGYVKDQGYLTVPLLRKGMDQFNERLLEICAELGVEVVDLSSMNAVEAYFYDDCHFTEAGAREVARLIHLQLAGAQQERPTPTAAAQPR